MEDSNRGAGDGEAVVRRRKVTRTSPKLRIRVGTWSDEWPRTRFSTLLRSVCELPAVEQGYGVSDRALRTGCTQGVKRPVRWAFA